jgi:hypothetical protein
MIIKKFKEKFNLTLPKNESIHKLRNKIEQTKCYEMMMQTNSHLEEHKTWKMGIITHQL